MALWNESERVEIRRGKKTSVRFFYRAGGKINAGKPDNHTTEGHHASGIQHGHRKKHNCVHRREHTQPHHAKEHYPCGSCRSSSRYSCPHRHRKSTRLNSSHVAISYAVF